MFKVSLSCSLSLKMLSVHGRCTSSVQECTPFMGGALRSWEAHSVHGRRTPFMGGALRSGRRTSSVHWRCTPFMGGALRSWEVHSIHGRFIGDALRSWEVHSVDALRSWEVHSVIRELEMNAIATISMFAFVRVFNTRTRIVIIISSRSSTRVRGVWFS